MVQVLKSRSDLSRCAIFRPATAEFRFNLDSAVKEHENSVGAQKHKGF